MSWIAENYMAVIFLVTTILAVVKWILITLKKNKAAEAVDELKKILHQTFGNVEILKIKWRESGAEDRFGHIGEIFAKINKQKNLEEILKEAYNQYLRERKR